MTPVDLFWLAFGLAGGLVFAWMFFDVVPPGKWPWDVIFLTWNWKSLELEVNTRADVIAALEVQTE